MKFKALFLALLAILSPTIFAMEKPTAQEVSASHVLKVIDIQGSEFSISPELSHALLKCTNIEALQFHPGVLDFTGLDASQRPFLSQDKIRFLAFLIMSPQSIEKDEFKSKVKNLDFFELAHYLGAPNNILYILSNELWPLMQEQKEDTESIKVYKKQCRQKAEPFLSCPEYFLQYLINNKINPFHAKIVIENDRETKINLNFNAFANLFHTASHYELLTEEQDSSYLKYKFYTLRGLDKLISFLLSKENQKSFDSIDLGFHNLETFSTQHIVNLSKTHAITIDLQFNNIKSISSKELDIASQSKLPFIINLSNNPIFQIDESFFATIRNLRSQGVPEWGGGGMHNFIFKNNELTDEKQKEYIKKFYYATHTLPERIGSRGFYERISFWGGGILTGLMTARLSRSLFESNFAVLSSAMMGFLAGGCAGHIVTGYTLSKLAQKTHPLVANFSMAMIEGGERYKLELK